MLSRRSAPSAHRETGKSCAPGHADHRAEAPAWKPSHALPNLRLKRSACKEIRWPRDWG